MSCEKIALALSVLGMVAVGAILTFGGATIYRRHLYFGDIFWRLSWWAAWLSFIAGIALAAFLCGSPAS